MFSNPHIQELEKQDIIVIRTSLPESKGRHHEINGQKIIFLDEELSEIEAINVLLHEKAHILREDLNNILYQVPTYSHRIENETEKDKIIDFLSLINQEYPIDDSFNYIDYMRNAFIPSQYEDYVQEIVKKLYQENSQGDYL